VYLTYPFATTLSLLRDHRPLGLSTYVVGEHHYRKESRRTYEYAGPCNSKPERLHKRSIDLFQLSLRMHCTHGEHCLWLSSKKKFLRRCEINLKAFRTRDKEKHILNKSNLVSQISVRTATRTTIYKDFPLRLKLPNLINLIVGHRSVTAPDHCQAD
jgi:hypothetical protein